MRRTTQRNALVLASGLSLFAAHAPLAVVALLGGCGASQNPCEQACDKLRSCAQRLQCDALADVTAKERCAEIQAAAAEDTCGLSQCTVYNEARAQEVNACKTIDPQTCGCADPPTGEQTACEQANAKMNRCLQAQDCAQLTGQDRTVCELLQSGGESYAFMGICAGENEAKAKAFNACDLEPVKCQCLTAQ